MNSFISRGKNQIGILLVYSVETGINLMITLTASATQMPLQRAVRRQIPSRTLITAMMTTVKQRRARNRQRQQKID